MEEYPDNIDDSYDNPYSTYDSSYESVDNYDDKSFYSERPNEEYYEERTTSNDIYEQPRRSSPRPKLTKMPSFLGTDTPSPAKQPDNITIGTTVEHIKSGKVGVVQYIGRTHVTEGTWVGIVLDTPLGKNDGSIGGIRYFTAAPNYGVFWKLQDVALYGVPSPTSKASYQPKRLPKSSTRVTSSTSTTTKRVTETTKSPKKSSPPAKSYEQKIYTESSSYATPPFHSTPSPGWKTNKTSEKQYPQETKMSNCVSCHRVIHVRGIEFDNKFYHPTCFRCANCNHIIREIDDFFARDGEPFCITCPPEPKRVQTLEHDPMTVHVCCKCNKPAMNPVALGQTPTFWHPHCFTCTKCNVRINKQVWEKDGLPYCILHKPDNSFESSNF